MRIRSAAAVALALAAAGCAGGGREVMTARLEIAPATACATTPSVTGAAQMTQKKKDDPQTATIRFDEKSACLNDAAGNRGVYAVIELPAGDVGPVDLAGVLVFELHQAAFAAAVAQRLPFRRSHVLQLLRLPERRFVHGAITHPVARACTPHIDRGRRPPASRTLTLSLSRKRERGLDRAGSQIESPLPRSGRGIG